MCQLELELGLSDGERHFENQPLRKNDSKENECHVSISIKFYFNFKKNFKNSESCKFFYYHYYFFFF